MNKRTVVLYLLIVFLFTASHLPCAAQYGYSNKDLAQIHRSREKIIEGKTSLYAIGRFFESIYDRYKDTSMNAAIRCYTFIANIEGPDNSKTSQQAAYRLGEIYANGKGVPVNLDHALAYYFISGEIGSKKLAAAKKRFAGRDSVAFVATDSLVIAYHPLLGVKNASSTGAIDRLVKVMRDHPQRTLNITLEKPTTFYSAIYAYWITQKAPFVLVSFLSQNFDIAEDRIQLKNDGYFTGSQHGYRVTLTLGIDRTE